MEIFISTLSVLVVTGVVWVLNRVLRLRVCPICAGVFCTWLWIVIGLFLGLLEAENWKMIAAIAMGGSVVGIAYQAEKKLAGSKLLLFKTLFIPAGFVAIYGALMGWRLIFLAALVFLALVAFMFFYLLAHRSHHESKTTEDLEEKMKNCC